MQRDAIRVQLVDDHAVVRAGYRTLLEGALDIVVVAEAESGEAACRAYNEWRPQVVIMDWSLPGMSGLEATQRILARDVSARILVFSMHEETAFVEQALQAGARGYITKRSAPDVLIEAVRQVAAGKTYLEHEIAHRLAIHRAQGHPTSLEALSAREFEIFCFLAQGLGVNQIAKRLSLSYKTVANYSTQIKNKLEVNTVAELTRLAIRHGILKP
ncbi:MAG: response regulator [Gammaproteobacteria bacterium]